MPFLFLDIDVNVLKSADSVVAICISVVILILSLHLLYQLFVKYAARSLKYKFLCAVFSMMNIPLTICNWLTRIADNAQRRFLFNTCFNIFYNLVNVSLYLIIIIRLHDTFSNSVYRTSSMMYIFLLLLVACYFIIYSVWITNNILRNEETNDLNDTYDSFDAFLFNLVINASLLIIGLILTVVIIYLFCRNLILLAASINSPKVRTSTTTKDVELTSSHSSTNITKEYILTRTQSPNANNLIEKLTPSTPLMSSASIDQNEAFTLDEGASFHLNSEQRRLISLTVRLIVLNVPALISRVVIWSLSITTRWLGYFENTNIHNDYETEGMYDHILYWMLRSCMIPLDIVLNYFCVYLAFDFAAQYYKWICFIHKLCSLCFERAVTRRIEPT